jgi:hypothetical protein
MAATGIAKKNAHLEVQGRRMDKLIAKSRTPPRLQALPSAVFQQSTTSPSSPMLLSVSRKLELEASLLPQVVPSDDSDAALSRQSTAAKPATAAAAQVALNPSIPAQVALHPSIPAAAQVALKPSPAGDTDKTGERQKVQAKERALMLEQAQRLKWQLSGLTTRLAAHTDSGRQLDERMSIASVLPQLGNTPSDHSRVISVCQGTMCALIDQVTRYLHGQVVHVVTHIVRHAFEPKYANCPVAGQGPTSFDTSNPFMVAL